MTARTDDDFEKIYARDARKGDVICTAYGDRRNSFEYTVLEDPWPLPNSNRVRLPVKWGDEDHQRNDKWVSAFNRVFYRLKTPARIKRGDRVEYVGGHNGITSRKLIGKVGEVTYIDDRTAKVRWDDDGLDDYFDDHGMFPENLRLVEPESESESLEDQLLRSLTAALDTQTKRADIAEAKLESVRNVVKTLEQSLADITAALGTFRGGL